MQGGGGKMMIWGCITFFGPGDAGWIQGKVDSDSYLDVVRDYVRQSRDWWGMDQETFIFQQDNASVHTARKVIDFFEENNITILAWSPTLSRPQPDRTRLGVHEKGAGSLPGGS
jgi:hypothetical protein